MTDSGDDTLGYGARGADTPGNSWVRKRLKELIGSAACTCLGALVGLSVPGDGNAAHVTLICLLAFLGWLFWVRRGRPLRDTFAICFGLLLSWWLASYSLRRI